MIPRWRKAQWFPSFLEHCDSTTQVLPLNSVRLLPGGLVEGTWRFPDGRTEQGLYQVEGYAVAKEDPR